MTSKGLYASVPRNIYQGRQNRNALMMFHSLQLVGLLIIFRILDNVGNDADPWLVTASLIAGPEGSTVEGVKTVPVKNGFANFTELVLSTEGTDYQLSFTVTYPEGLTIPSVDSIIFEVGPRPLGVK